MARGDKPVLHTSVMTAENAGRAIGVSAEVIRGWSQKGYVRSFKVGKHRLYDLSSASAFIAEMVTANDACYVDGDDRFSC